MKKEFWCEAAHNEYGFYCAPKSFVSSEGKLQIPADMLKAIGDLGKDTKIFFVKTDAGVLIMNQANYENSLYD